MSRLSGKGNYLWIGELGAEATTGALAPEGYFKITSVGETTGFPGTPEPIVNDIVYNKPAITLGTGDAAKPFTLSKLGFVTDVPQSASKEKFEDTVQIDNAKSYEEGDKPEITGNVDGYFITGDDTVDAILNRFFQVIEDDGAGTVTYKPTTTGALHFFLGRNETTTVGEVEIMEYMPAIIDTLTVDKPMQGKQTFSFAYTVVGSERPAIVKRTITA